MQAAPRCPPACWNPNGCGWWGCWQWDQLAPGQYLRDYFQQTINLGQVPMITYYQMLHASRVSEGSPEVAAAHGIGMIFGAGEQTQTNPATDSGHLLLRTNNYFLAGGQPACLNASMP